MGGLTQKQKKILTAGLIILAVYLGMKYIVPVFIPFLVAGLICAAIKTPVNWLYKRLHINKSISAAGLLLLMAAALIFLLWLICSRLLTQLEDFICYCDCYEGQIEKNFVRICCELESLIGIDALQIEQQLTRNFDMMINAVKTEKIPLLMDNSFLLLKKLGRFFAFVIVTFISVLLITRDIEKIKDRFKRNENCKLIYQIMKKIMDAAGTYLKAQLIIMSLVSFTCILAFLFLKNPYALLLGVLIGFFDALPFIGTGIVLIPWTVVELFMGSYREAVILFVLFIVCSLIRELLEPKLIGKQLGVYPIAVLASIYVGIRLFGIGGIILGPISVLIISELMNSLTKQDK